MKKIFGAVYSGGKDGHIALLRLLERGERISCLITIDGGSLHNVFFNDLRKVRVLREHAGLLGLPLLVLRAPGWFSGGENNLPLTIKYLYRAAEKKYGVNALCCGASDFDEAGDAASFRAAASSAGISLETPAASLALADTLEEMKKLGVKAVIVGVEPKVSPDWLGKDPCSVEFSEYIRESGERGVCIDGNDFQTLVLESPAFSGRRITITGCEKIKVYDSSFLKINKIAVLPCEI